MGVRGVEGFCRLKCTIRSIVIAYGFGIDAESQVKKVRLQMESILVNNL